MISITQSRPSFLEKIKMTLFTFFFFLCLTTIVRRSSAVVCHFDGFRYNSWRSNSMKDYESEWPELCVKGKMQSPIDIMTNSVVEGEDADALKLINYDRPLRNLFLFNNGHAAKVTLSDEDSAAVGIVVDNVMYNLKQFHFHVGSEHQIDSHAFPMEMHLVHKAEGQSKYAVIGIFFERPAIGLQNRPPNRGLDSIIDDIKKVINPGNAANINALTIRSFFNDPSDGKVFRYDGSFTTPPCTEGVKWFLFSAPSYMNVKQMKAMEALKRCDDQKNTHRESDRLMKGNFRTTRPLNGRKIVSVATTFG